MPVRKPLIVQAWTKNVPAKPAGVFIQSAAGQRHDGPAAQESQSQ